MYPEKGLPMATPNVLQRFKDGWECVNATASKFDHPFMVMFGLKDTVVCIHKAREVYKAAKTTDKEFFEIPDGRHELHKDAC